ncbi:hypothetical protein J3F83DRAFT_714430 [Trichoderma novae-zelandiae]
MPQLSDIEEGSSSGGTAEPEEDHGQRKKNDADSKETKPETSPPVLRNHTSHSIGKAQGLKLRQVSHPSHQHQSLPTCMTVFSPALPPPPPPSSSPVSSSSSSSSRTITPPHSSHPSLRVSSSGTVQVVSPGAMSVTTGSGAWSPLGRVVSEGVGSETSSTATISAYNHHDQDRNDGQRQRQRQNQQYVLGGVPPAGRPPLWWMNDASASGAALGVLTAFAWMAMWRDDAGLGAVSGGMLRSMSSLATASVLVLSFATLMVHEIRLLSPVVLLYLQAAILALTTISATSMWMECVREDDGMAKRVLVSCGTLLWGASAMAFLRAAVVWRVSLGEDEGAGGRSGDEAQGGYATFQGSG